MTNFGGLWLSLIDVGPVQQQIVANAYRRTKNLSSNHHRLPVSLRTGSVDYYWECIFLTNGFLFLLLFLIFLLFLVSMRWINLAATRLF